MKAYIDTDELYPYFKMTPVDDLKYGYGDEQIEVPDELYARYRAATSEFFAVQRELRTLCRWFD